MRFLSAINNPHCMGVLAARDAHHDTIPGSTRLKSAIALLTCRRVASQFVELEAALALIASPSLLSRLVTCRHALSGVILSLTAQMLLHWQPRGRQRQAYAIVPPFRRHRGSSPRQRTPQALAGNSSLGRIAHIIACACHSAQRIEPPLTCKTAPLGGIDTRRLCRLVFSVV